MSSHIHNKLITVSGGTSTTVPASKHYLVRGKGEMSADRIKSNFPGPLFLYVLRLSISLSCINSASLSSGS